MVILENTVLIAFGTISVLIFQSYGQSTDCVPQAVHNLTISSNATLWWELTANEPCEITSFVINITGDRQDEYNFTVIENFIDLPFLEICELWHFTVTPMSHEISGYARTLTSHVPLPPDADLSLSYFRFTLTDGAILLDWDLSNQTFGECTLEYRLTLQDLDLGTAVDVYVEGKTARLNDTSNCVSYELNLRAINIAYPIIEGPMRRLNFRVGPRAQTAPILKSVVAQATSVNTTWALEGDSNRCPLRNFYVDGGNYFNFSVSLQGQLDLKTVPVEIKSLRPNSMYYFRASVENSGGRSTSTQVAVQTLLLTEATPQEEVELDYLHIED